MIPLITIHRAQIINHAENPKPFFIVQYHVITYPIRNLCIQYYTILEFVYAQH